MKSFCECLLWVFWESLIEFDELMQGPGGVQEMAEGVPGILLWLIQIDQSTNIPQQNEDIQMLLDIGAPYKNLIFTKRYLT